MISIGVGIVLKALFTLVLTTAAVYAVTVVLAIALVALINAYYAMKERIQHSRFYKIFKILIKLSEGKIEQIVVVVGPDGHVMEEKQSETFTAEAMKGTAIEAAFNEADTYIEGYKAIKLDIDKDEENKLREKAAGR